MADILISGLTAAASLAGTDVLEIDTGVLSRKVTGTVLQTFVLGSVTTTELGRLSGVTSAIQTQIDTKAATSGYTASRALETSSGGVLQVSATTAADLAEIAGLAAFTEGLRVFLTPQTISTTGAITLGTTHQNSFLYMTNSSTTTFTVPPNSTTAFNVGTEIEFWRSDASVVITEGSGVTLNGHDGTANVTTTATLATQHTGCCIKKVATDTWVVFGRHTSS